ncbi:MAG: CdaR family protein [Bryobacteraceae bacterium]|nr:CdaR family protein [Bryobacteraceae bacterium]
MRWFTGRNLGWKFAALAISFLLWFAINGANDLTESVSVPVQYRNIPQNLDIGSDLIEQVHLILRGPSLLLSRASNNPSPVVIDLAEVKGPGERTFSITAANVRLPGGVMLEKALPGQIRLRLESRMRKTVPVHVRLDHLPDGMDATVDEINPSKLTIVGPENRVRSIEVVETDVVDVRAMEPGGRARVSAYAPDPRVGFTTSPNVSVRISLVPLAEK